MVMVSSLVSTILKLQQLNFILSFILNSLQLHANETLYRLGSTIFSCSRCRPVKNSYLHNIVVVYTRSSKIKCTGYMYLLFSYFHCILEVMLQPFVEVGAKQICILVGIHRMDYSDIICMFYSGLRSGFHHSSNRIPSSIRHH